MALTDDQLREAVALASKYKNTNLAAKSVGMDSATLKYQLKIAEERGITAPHFEPPAIELPEFPDEDIDIERVIELQCERFSKRLASHKAHTWFPVTVNDTKPIGLMWFGDPHLDDNGCDWPTLKHHCEICRTTPGVFAINIGDSTNNWVGRLTRLYAEQDTSVSTARRLAEWFLLSSGVRWLAVLLGNHDTWGDGAEILIQMAKRHGTQKIVCHNWEARFRLVFPDGWEPRVFASHDFKGNSIWNPMHGPMREGQLGEDADLYVCGHKHTSAEFGFENVARGRFQRFVRVRGYKFMDDYARVHGFKEQRSGTGALTIFDPQNRSISVHFDVDDGARYLRFLRGEHSPSE